MSKDRLHMRGLLTQSQNLHPATHIRGNDGEMVAPADVLSPEEMRGMGFASAPRGAWVPRAPIRYDPEQERQAAEELAAALAAIPDDWTPTTKEH